MSQGFILRGKFKFIMFIIDFNGKGLWELDFLNVCWKSHGCILCRWHLSFYYAHGLWYNKRLSCHRIPIYMNCKVDHQIVVEITSFNMLDSHDLKSILSVIRPWSDPVIRVRWLIWIPFQKKKNRSAFSGPVTQYGRGIGRNEVEELVLICCWIALESHGVDDRLRHR